MELTVHWRLDRLITFALYSSASVSHKCASGYAIGTAERERCVCPAKSAHTHQRADLAYHVALGKIVGLTKAILPRAGTS